MLIGILIFAAGVFVMILVHELGHFVTAKRFGIKVEEFFVGFGPRLWSFRRGQTEYGLKAIPLGGYVRIAGMNPFQEPAPEDRHRVFTAKPAWQRAIVLVSGALTHFVLAFLLLLTLFWFVGVPVFGGAQVVGVTAEIAGQASPAAEAGLRPGDRFVRVDGRPVESYRGFVDYIDAQAGQELELVVRRDGDLVTLRATPIEVREDGEQVGRLGIIVGQSLIGRDPSGPIEGIADAGLSFGRMFTGSFAMVGQAFGPEGIGRIGELLVGGEERSVRDPVGIVGVARVAGQAVEAGLAEAFLEMFAFFNVFVGILNLFPLPPLDGGHLAVLGIESITGRRLDQRRLIPVTALVVAFLLLFTVSLLYLDVVRPIPNPFQ